MTEKTKSEDKITLIPITELVSSPLNARKTFKQLPLNELAEDIRTNKLLQYPIVRIKTSLTDSNKSIWYEIVFGERRIRACKILYNEGNGLMYEVPCIVRDYTDDEVEAIQLAENIHREDLSPMEECEAYSKLLKHHKTVQRVSEVAGKSANYVSSRMQLKSLIKEFQKFLNDGSLPIAQAIIIAKLPEEQQKAISKNNSALHIYKNKIMEIASVEKLKRIIADEVYIPINSAVFDVKDKQLNPKMGACTECIFNTGTNKTLFEDITDESFCMKASCFVAKSWKYIKARIKMLEDAGEKPIFIYETNYYYGTREETIENIKCLPSCDYDISKTKKEGFNNAVVLKPCRGSSRFFFGEEVFVKKSENPQRSNSGKKTVPSEESPIEQRERRMKKRFEKEDNLDKIEVRKQIATVVSKEKNLSKSIIREAAGALIFTFRENNLFVFRKYGIDIPGYTEQETANLELFNVDDEEIDKLLDKIKTESDLLQLIKYSVVTSHLDLQDRVDVNLTDAKDDDLIKIAKEYGIDIPAFLKPLIEARKKERVQEFSDLDAAKKRSKEREKKTKKAAKTEQKSKDKKSAKNNERAALD